jgi:hypothetical protein
LNPLTSPAVISSCLQKGRELINETTRVVILLREVLGYINDSLEVGRYDNLTLLLLQADGGTRAITSHGCLDLLLPFRYSSAPGLNNCEPDDTGLNSCKLGD